MNVDRKGLAQDELLKLPDVAYTSLVKIESDANKNSTINTLKIANTLNLKIDGTI